MVVLEIIVPKGQFPERFDKFIAGNNVSVNGTDETIKLTRSSALKYYNLQCILLNGELITEIKTKVRPDDILTINIDDSKNSGNNSNSLKELVGCPDIKLEILHHDENIIVLNKVAGMLVHPPSLKEGSVILSSKSYTHTLVNALISLCGKEKLSNCAGSDRLGIVHRLDKDTSGIMIIAKDNKIHDSIKSLFEKHTENSIKLVSKYKENGFESTNKSHSLIEKINTLSSNTIQKKYVCMIIGKLKNDHGTITKAIARHPKDKNKMVIDEKNGKESITEYKVIKVWNKVEVNVYDLQQSIHSNTDETNEYDNIISKMKKQKTNGNVKKSNQSNSMKYLAIDDDEEEEEEEEEDDSEEEEEEEDSDYDSDNELDDITDDSEDEEEEEDEVLRSEERKVKRGSPTTFSLVEITLHTGRSHQIRIHMASEGNPIIGDTIYSTKSAQFMTPYLLLSSMNLQFKHPITSNKHNFSVPFPKHFQDFIDNLDTQSQIQKQSSQKLISAPSFKILNSDSLYPINTNKEGKNTKNNINNELKNILSKNSNSSNSVSSKPNNPKAKNSNIAKEKDFDQMFFGEKDDFGFSNKKKK